MISFSCKDELGYRVNYRALSVVLVPSILREMAWYVMVCHVWGGRGTCMNGIGSCGNLERSSSSIFLTFTCPKRMALKSSVATEKRGREGGRGWL
jgi:hypothetical protein